MQNLPKSVSQALNKQGIVSLNPMQTESLAEHEVNKNVLLYSPTGSGKTFAFLLPLLQRLSSKAQHTQAVILVPARELAIQIESVFKSLQSGLKVSCCYGGHSVRIEKNNLAEAPAVLIGTPGRIAYHFRNENVDSNTINHVIIDEFDKALEFGFLRDIEEIYSYLPNIKNQTFTSATEMESFPACTKFKNEATINFLHQKKEISLDLFTVKAEHNDKLEALLKLICHCGSDRSLIFCNHREAVDRISDLLNDKGLYHGCFHGGMDQADRERALIRFRNGSHHILLTTDLASRGIDIPEIHNVIHYQMPTSADAYTHRNGRTARMHASGKAYFVLAEDGFLPDFIIDDAPEATLTNTEQLPSLPEWVSLYIDKGKKDKVNKVDIVGFFFKVGKLGKTDLGLIEVQDYASIVAVKHTVAKKLLTRLKNERLKNKKVKIQFAKG